MVSCIASWYWRNSDNFRFDNWSRTIFFIGAVFRIYKYFGVIKKNINKNNNIKNFKNEFYLILIFLSIPLLIFLNSTAKPQLIFISYSTLAFAITFFNLKIEKSNSNLYKFFLIILLLYVGFEGKFSFILSAFIISIISSFKNFKR